MATATRIFRVSELTGADLTQMSGELAEAFRSTLPRALTPGFDPTGAVDSVVG